MSKINTIELFKCIVRNKHHCNEVFLVDARNKFWNIMANQRNITRDLENCKPKTVSVSRALYLKYERSVRNYIRNMKTWL